jgi:hypothetical protein
MPDSVHRFFGCPQRLRVVVPADERAGGRTFGDQVVTEKLERSPHVVVREVLGERRPSGWVLAKLHDGRGPTRSVLHEPDCEEAPAGAPLLDVGRALDAAEHPATRLCTLCGAAQDLTPLLRGFDHITDSVPDDSFYAHGRALSGPEIPETRPGRASRRAGRRRGQPGT